MLLLCWLFQFGSYFVIIVVIIVNEKHWHYQYHLAFVAPSSLPGYGIALFFYKIILSTFLHWLQHHVLIRRSNMYRNINYRTLERVTICVLVGLCKKLVYLHTWIYIYFFLIFVVRFLIKSAYKWLRLFTLLGSLLWLSKLGSLCSYFHGFFISSLFHFVLLAGIPHFYFFVGL